MKPEKGIAGYKGMKYLLAIVLVASILMACKTPQEEQKSTVKNKVEKTDEEWKAELTPEEYYILRQQGTERAFTGKFYKHKETGMYTCAGCGNSLFKSDTKYESGSGWPSYYDYANDSSVITKTDRSHGMVRTEVECARCGGHLGHVFEDGPGPSGLRYCINSAALDFEGSDDDAKE